MCLTNTINVKNMHPHWDSNPSFRPRLVGLLTVEHPLNSLSCKLYQVYTILGYTKPLYKIHQHMMDKDQKKNK